MIRMARTVGFTLLEVMVSIAILAVSLTVLMTFSGNTLVASGRAERVTIATMLARQKMVDLELEIQKGLKRGEFPDERSEGGTFDEPYEDYRWEMEITRVELPAPPMPAEGEGGEGGGAGGIQAVIGKQLTKEIAKAVRQLKLVVTWEELGEEQTLDVVTHIVKI